MYDCNLITTQAANSLTDQANVRQLLETRSIELFKMCDLENKGFINKKDMHRMVSIEPGMTPEVLEEVFESLDTDHNGFLTLEEFTFGFTSLFMPTNQIEEPLPNNDTKSHIIDEEEDENAFKETMENLGVNDELINNR